MKKSLLTLLAVGLLAPAIAPAQDEPVNVTDQRERWYYGSYNPGSDPFTSRTSTSGLWSVPPGGSFPFHYRSAASIFEFDLGLPAGIDENNYIVTEATITMWVAPEQEWDSSTEFELFALGYNPQGFTDPLEDDFYTRATFDIEFSPTIAYSPPGSSPVVRDPFMRNLADDSNADEQVTGATPWALGDYNTSEVSPSNTEPLLVTFTLDVSDPKIQAKIQEDIDLGQARWYVTSTAEVSGMGAAFPAIYHSSTTTIPSPAEPPVLSISAANDAPTSVSNWQLFN